MTLWKGYFTLVGNYGCNKGFCMDDVYFLENKLKLARVEKDLTQKQLAKLAGISRQTVIAIESQQYSPSVKLALILAKCLEKNINEIFILHGPNKQEDEE